jgi:NAD(P)-dependent dehydrogenase (short-subunit alcohol dehydrogenase family)
MYIYAAAATSTRSSNTTAPGFSASANSWSIGPKTAHWVPAKPLPPKKEFAMPTGKYGATTTAAEIVTDVDLHGRRAVVTGASSGIGVETARALASAGADVTLAVRNVEAGTKVAAGIAEKLSAGAGAVHVARLDLADPVSVADFVRAWTGPLHILVNNAGVMALPQLTRTPSGYEMQFATNHLGHFVLTTGLHKSLAAAPHARVVCVASSGHPSPQSSSTTCTTGSARTTSGPLTASPSRPSCFSQSKPRIAGPATALPPTR